MSKAVDQIWALTSPFCQVRKFTPSGKNQQFEKIGQMGEIAVHPFLLVV